MGYNRPGNARKKRLKRAKRYNERLLKKAEAAAKKSAPAKAKPAAAATAGAGQGKNKDAGHQSSKAGLSVGWVRAMSPQIPNGTPMMKQGPRHGIRANTQAMRENARLCSPRICTAPKRMPTLLASIARLQTMRTTTADSSDVPRRAAAAAACPLSKNHTSNNSASTSRTSEIALTTIRAIAGPATLPCA